MAKVFVFSTLTCDQDYHNWVAGGGDLKSIDRTIRIKGGTGVANDRIITPYGVMTEIDESELVLLESNPVFKIHAENGFVRVERKSADPEKVAADMASRDGSAPLTPGDYANQPESAVQAPDVGNGSRGKSRK